MELDQGQMVDRELVIPGRDTPTLLDLVEESFDQVVRAVQVPTKLLTVPHGAALAISRHPGNSSVALPRPLDRIISLSGAAVASVCTRPSSNWFMSKLSGSNAST